MKLSPELETAILEHMQKHKVHLFQKFVPHQIDGVNQAVILPFNVLLDEDNNTLTFVDSILSPDDSVIVYNAQGKAGYYPPENLNLPLDNYPQRLSMAVLKVEETLSVVERFSYFLQVCDQLIQLHAAGYQLQELSNESFYRVKDYQRIHIRFDAQLVDLRAADSTLSSALPASVLDYIVGLHKELFPQDESVNQLFRDPYLASNTQVLLSVLYYCWAEHYNPVLSLSETSDYTWAHATAKLIDRIVPLDKSLVLMRYCSQLTQYKSFDSSFTVSNLCTTIYSLVYLSNKATTEQWYGCSAIETDPTKWIVLSSLVRWQDNFDLAMSFVNSSAYEQFIIENNQIYSRQFIMDAMKQQQSKSALRLHYKTYVRAIGKEEIVPPPLFPGLVMADEEFDSKEDESATTTSFDAESGRARKTMKMS